MTDLEKMNQAHKNILDLANGTDPISGTILPHDTCLNNVHLSRCFFYVADILRRIIEKGFIAPAPIPFVASANLKEKLTVANTPMQITAFTRQINEVASALGMKKLPVIAFTDWLVDQGYLEEKLKDENKRRREPTIKGNSLGITTEIRNGPPGVYTAVLYNDCAQKFIIDHLEEIAFRWTNK